MKKLPVGISSFSKLIENDYIYIDKTKYLYDMINSGELYFLSRPRRFGKSLIVSTLGEIFKGNKDLFEGLYIHNKWNFDEKYPVIHLDFNDIRHTTPEKLENTLNDFANSEAREHDIKLYNSDLTNRFSELIKGINKKYKRKVAL